MTVMRNHIHDRKLALSVLAVLILGLAASLVAPSIAHAAVSVSNPKMVADESMTAKQVTTWDCVWLGSYPQSEVTASDAEFAKMESAKWDANGDATVNGVKYRRLFKSEATNTTWGAGMDYWPEGTTCRYFKYEPIKWRVLEVNGTQALVVADVILDDLRYNENRVASTWEKSSLRSWLNGYGASENEPGISYTAKSFIGAAFSADEQAAILVTDVVNEGNKKLNTAGGNDTKDKVFLLSESDVYDESAVKHGFVSDPEVLDEARWGLVSDFATGMGAIRSYPNETSEWWLRSPGYGAEGNFSFSACFVNTKGQVYGCVHQVNSTTDGVRPAMTVSLEASCVTFAGTVSSNGSSSEPGGSDTDTALVKKGSTYKVSGMKYKVTALATANEAGTATLVKAKNASSVTVPASIKLADGRAYDINSVAKGAFKGLSKVTTVALGKNVATVAGGVFSDLEKLSRVTLGASVKKVGEGAFSNTPRLAQVTVEGTLLKQKSSVAGMLKGSELKQALTVKAPKSMKTTYKKVFTKKNLKSPKKVTVK